MREQSLYALFFLVASHLNTSDAFKGFSSHCSKKTDLIKSSDILTFHPNETFSSFSDRLFNCYNKEQDPGQYGPYLNGTAVNVSIHISSLSEIRVDNMDFRVDMYLAQEWRDPRLQFRGELNDFKLHGKATEQVWQPDLFFPNEKKAEKHTVASLNSVIRISSDGEVYLNQRLTLTFACVMALQYYPMDTQICPIRLESYGHTARELLFRWIQRDGEESAVTFDNLAMQSPDFENPIIKVTQKEVKYGGSKDTFMSLQAHFVLHRRIMAYLMDSYLPFICVTLVSLTSCWISVNAIPARASIGVITVLSIVVHNAGTQRRLANVSYLKAIDYYMLCSLLVVLLAWVEFCLAHQLATREEKMAKQKSVWVHQKRNKNGSQTAQCTWKSSLSSRDNFAERRLRCIKITSTQLDRLARWLLPLFYLLFNVIYWTWLGVHREQQRHSSIEI